MVSSPLKFGYIFEGMMHTFFALFSHVHSMQLLGAELIGFRDFPWAEDFEKAYAQLHERCETFDCILCSYSGEALVTDMHTYYVRALEKVKNLFWVEDHHFQNIMMHSDQYDKAVQLLSPSVGVFVNSNFSKYLVEDLFQKPAYVLYLCAPPALIRRTCLSFAERHGVLVYSNSGDWVGNCGVFLSKALNRQVDVLLRNESHRHLPELLAHTLDASIFTFPTFDESHFRSFLQRYRALVCLREWSSGYRAVAEAVCAGTPILSNARPEVTGSLTVDFSDFLQIIELVERLTADRSFFTQCVEEQRALLAQEEKGYREVFRKVLVDCANGGASKK